MSFRKGKIRDPVFDGPDPLNLKQDVLGLDRRGLRRELIHLESGQGIVVRLEGKQVINLSSNDYLGLASHPVVGRAVCNASKFWGGGAGASRLVTGGTQLHRTAEDEAAAFLGMDSARLFGCGYMANIGVIVALAGEEDEVFSDERNHASIIDGCRLSRASVEIFRHNDSSHLETLLALSSARRKIVVVEGLYSMDGDLADLPGIIGVARRHGAFVVVDEAHALGVVGPTGRGALEHFGIETNKGDIAVVGTFGKAFGAYGAFVAGPSVLAELLANRARTMLYSTALPPHVIAAARAGMLLAEQEPWRRMRALEAADELRSHLRGMGQAVTGGNGPIVSVLVGSPEAAVETSRRLLENGVLARAFRPPTVPDGTSRLRLAATALLDDEMLHKVERVLEDVFDVK